VVIDLGTGAGQAVLRRARQEPQTLIVGIDADQRAMAHASQRGRAPANALFLVEAAERLPGILAGRADLVTVALPWGSLLRALIEPGPATLAGIAALLKADGQLELLLTDELRSRAVYEAAGLRLVDSRPATADDVARLSSAWGKRLGVAGRRAATVSVFRSMCGTGRKSGAAAS
jgi:16S rRNA (adenine(1408)-N(1))-methyltransferase